MARLRVPSATNPASISHGALGGLLSADDHPQYLNETRLADLLGGELKATTVTVTAAQMKALNATPIQLLAAPGAGKALILVGAELWLDYESAAYAGIAAGEDLAIKYTDASGATLATIEATGFLDATADAFRYAYPVTTAAVTPVANAAIVLHLLTGEIITGDSTLKLRLLHREVALTW